jgi:hypothetical protein
MLGRRRSCTYKHSGVDFEDVSSGVLAIDAASASIDAFSGHVRRDGVVTADHRGTCSRLQRQPVRW